METWEGTGVDISKFRRRPQVGAGVGGQSVGNRFSVPGAMLLNQISGEWETGEGVHSRADY